MFRYLKLMWWWYITIEQYPYHPNKYRKFSTFTEKHYRHYIALQLEDGVPILAFYEDELIKASF